MIANWIHDSVTSQVVITRLSAFFPASQHDNDLPERSGALCQEARPGGPV